MNKNLAYIDYLIDESCEDLETTNTLFDKTEDALFSLYEEMFHSSETIDEKRIYNALKYLLWVKGMKEQYEEIDSLTEEDLCVRHFTDVNKEVKNSLAYFKCILNEAINNFV